LLTLLLLVMGFPLASSAQPPSILRVTVLDNEGNPIPEVKLSVQREDVNFSAQLQMPKACSHS